MCLLESSVFKGRKFAAWSNAAWPKQDWKFGNRNRGRQVLAAGINSCAGGGINFSLNSHICYRGHVPLPRYLEVSQLCIRVGFSISFSATMFPWNCCMLWDFLWRKRERGRHMYREKPYPIDLEIWSETFEETNVPWIERSQQVRWMNFCIHWRNHKGKVTRIQQLIQQKRALPTFGRSNAHLESCLGCFS